MSMIVGIFTGVKDMEMVGRERDSAYTQPVWSQSSMVFPVERMGDRHHLCFPSDMSVL